MRRAAAAPLPGLGVAARMRRGLAAGLLLLAAGVGAQADPMNPASATPGELARLPDYCNHVWGYTRDPGERANWFVRMGPVFEHMHHYCWGMLKANRAANPGLSQMIRRSLYASAVQEGHYVLRNNPDANFALRPEILYRMGQWEVAMESWIQALDYYQQSIAAKAEYWPPYLGIADVHLRLGRRDRALAILEEGLKVMPGEPNLTQAMTRAKSAPPPRGASSR